MGPEATEAGKETPEAVGLTLTRQVRSPNRLKENQRMSPLGPWQRSQLTQGADGPVEAAVMLVIS